MSHHLANDLRLLWGERGRSLKLIGQSRRSFGSCRVSVGGHTTREHPSWNWGSRPLPMTESHAKPRWLERQ